MSDAVLLPLETAPRAYRSASAQRRLCDLGRGEPAMIHHVSDEGGADLERRLLELGFVEGAEIVILHEGLIFRDPIVVRVDQTRLALRRREAAHILVRRKD